MSPKPTLMTDSEPQPSTLPPPATTTTATTTTTTATTTTATTTTATTTTATTMDNNTGPTQKSATQSEATASFAGTNANASTLPKSSAPHSSSTAPNTKADQYPHHVIFVVHGMGRQLEEFGNYERNVGYLVENTKTVLQSQFRDLETDVHIIPIEWHAKLHSMVDQRMSLASLRTVPKVRLVMNDYFADILYYFNNYYGAEIVRIIVDELNEAYSTFIARHPDFNGKIAIYALSLGGVAMFDILTCMDDDDPDDMTDKSTNKAKSEAAAADNENKDSKIQSTASAPMVDTSMPRKKKIRKQDQPKFRSVVPKLSFRPNFLFTVGSPVGAVMVMRNLDWETFHPPDDIIHHNLFHPFDPLAYRVEPLIDPIFSAIPAVTLTSTGNSQLFPISLPSFASLPSIPGSISTFLGNKRLPIPSIHTAVQSTLTQVTQSLKVGRWLSGGGGAESDSRTSTPSGQSGRDRIIGAESILSDSGGEDSNPRGNKELSSHQKHQQYQRYRASHLYQRADADVSVTEAIAVATATTYLDQRNRGSSHDKNKSAYAGLSSLINDNIHTTTGLPNIIMGPAIRPSLGPRRVSSRVEDESDEEDIVTESFRASLPTTIESEEHYQKQQPESITEAAGPGSDEVPPPPHMDYLLGMEQGPSIEEKRQCAGAKSKVVQEDLVRSVPSSPTLDTHAGHKHFLNSNIMSDSNSSMKNGKGLDDVHATHVANETAKPDLDNKDTMSSKKVTIEDAEDLEDRAREGKDIDDDKGDNKTDKKESDAVKVEDNGSGRGPLLVNGRETKVPYRIDHVLQETRVDQYTNEYLLGMRSHFRYWGNRDIVYHILKNILQQKGSLENKVLDLKPEMPKPVLAPKSAKEAAKAKAKANAASHRKNQDNDHQRHTSFSFSAFNPFSGLEQSDGEESSSGYSRSEYYWSGSRGGNTGSFGAGYSGGWYGDEEELYGYRYSDLDMSSAANVGLSSSTLFQNSPFSKNKRTSAAAETGEKE
ncbi:hypothetical protein FBU30_007350 [Linnemannia zychae]|nr:hypothetical protein FBU30_007350 [Linnemannia zychae]